MLQPQTTGGEATARRRAAPPDDGGRPSEGWSHFPHVADLGLRGRAPTLEGAFEQVARALFAAIADLDAVEPVVLVTLACDAPNNELLLVDWLNALIYQATTRGLLFSRFSVRIEDGELLGEAWGERIDVRRHRPAVEPKGATLTELRVEQDANGAWTAQCVVDV